MRPPDDERRPRGRDGAPVVVTETDGHSVPQQLPSQAEAGDDGAGPGYAAWHAEWQAHCIVGYEALAQAALRSLSTQQLRDIRWIRLHDSGWSRMYDELDRRGEEL